MLYSTTWVAAYFRKIVTSAIPAHICCNNRFSKTMICDFSIIQHYIFVLSYFGGTGSVFYWREWNEIENYCTDGLKSLLIIIGK